MMTTTSPIVLPDLDVSRVAETVFRRVFRTSFTEPGFAVVVLPAAASSGELRQAMVGLKTQLSALHEAQSGEGLDYLSLGRFDQQNTTRLHLDGAPEQAYLMLGYEPTPVRSEFHIADYSRCAADLGLTPSEFLQRHNPMFGAHQEKLAGYVTTLVDWQEERPRIVVINNCSSAHGVLHGAIIGKPDLSQRRVINSSMLAPVSSVANDPAMQVTEFLTTDAISGPILALGREMA
jgi:hypothetical protein